MVNIMKLLLWIFLIIYFVIQVEVMRDGGQRMVAYGVEVYTLARSEVYNLLNEVEMKRCGVNDT